MNSVSLQNNSNSQEKQLFSYEFDDNFNISTNASPIKNKPVKILFAEDNISTDTGTLLLKEVDNNINLIDKIVAVTDYKRHESYIKHDLKTLFSQRIFQIASGYEDANDCNTLKNDPIFKMCADQLPESDNPLASQPTMTRLENSIDWKSIYNIAQVLFDNFIESYTKEPKIIVIDADDTDYTIHGEQEERLFNAYYGEYCYMPLQIYEGLSGKLIASILKPGRRFTGKAFLSILKRIVENIRKHWKNTIIVFRGDSHFASPEVMQYIESKEKLHYVTGLTGYVPLRQFVKEKIDYAKKRFELSTLKKTIKVYHSFYYQASTWDAPKRIVAKIEYGENGLNTRYIITDLAETGAKLLYEAVYCKRGEMELYIKNHKTYLKSGRCSCHAFKANQFRVLLHSVAYVLIHTLQKEVLKGTEFANSTMQTIQLKLLKIAGKVKELKTRINIELPLSYPYKEIFNKAFGIFSILRC